MPVVNDLGGCMRSAGRGARSEERGASGGVDDRRQVVEKYLANLEDRCAIDYTYCTL